MIDPLPDSGFRIPISYLNNKTLIKSELSNDLELTHGEHPLYQCLFNVEEDDIKKMALSQHSRWYTTNKKYLRDTQSVLKGDIPCPPNHDDISQFRKDSMPRESFLEKYNYIEWEKFQFINKHPQLLQWLSIYHICSPLISLALPIIMLMIPFFLIRIQNNSISWNTYCYNLQLVLRNHSLGQIFYIGSATWDKRIMIVISVIFYFVQVYFNCTSCVKFVKNMTTIHKNISIVKQYITESIHSMTYIANAWGKYVTYKPFIEKCNEILKTAQSIQSELNSVTGLTMNISKVAEIGRVMRINYMIHMDPTWKETLEYCVQYNSYIHSMLAMKDKIGKGIQFCKFGKRSSMFKAMTYPHIPTDQAISNDITLDKNILITGPNAAGKTTILKTIMINLLLCQQFGCGYFKHAKLQPYDILSSCINIPDTSGRDSLFQAEASRCKWILDEVTKHKNKRQFYIFDELFSGTNPYEAIGAATAYLKYLNVHKNVSFVLTTHFLDLCRFLDTTTNITNIQMQVKNNNNTFEYSYKIVEGISTIKGGIQILHELKYPLSIIEDSSTIISKLTI